MTRTASPADASALVALINTAFEVEAFFKIGDRTSREEILQMMASGEFLITRDSDSISGCVYVKCSGDRAYFGMLSIAPSRQGRGMGRQLIEAAEQRARDSGCLFMDIHIVNLREELPGLYRRFG